MADRTAARRSGAVRVLCERGAGTGVEGLGSPPAFANRTIIGLGLRASGVDLPVRRPLRLRPEGEVLFI
jgi:hypothetical protein